MNPFIKVRISFDKNKRVQLTSLPKKMQKLYVKEQSNQNRINRILQAIQLKGLNLTGQFDNNPLFE